MSKHTFVREEYQTAYDALQNNQHIIYCSGCGYVSFDSNSGNNEKRLANIPKGCGEVL